MGIGGDKYGCSTSGYSNENWQKFRYWLKGVANNLKPDKSNNNRLNGKHLSVHLYRPEANPTPPEKPESTKLTGSIFTATKTDLVNRYSSTTGEVPLVLDENNNVIQPLTFDGGNLHGVYTQTGFVMNNNEESTMRLSEDAQKFDEAFDRLNANKTAGSEETVSKEEFMAFLGDYSRNAEESASQGGAQFRKEEAVYFDQNKPELEKMFNAMAGKDGELTKDEYVDFWNDVMDKGVHYTETETGTKFTTVTGNDLNEVVNTRLEANGELPTFRKTDEEIQQIIIDNERQAKADELKALNVNIEQDFVQNIEYSKDKKISFLTLDDGTQIQINNEKNAETGLNITKEGDRYVINNNGNTAVDQVVILPGENSKITLRDCAGVTFLSPDEENDNIVVEGNANNVRLIVGGGTDTYERLNSENATYDNVRIVKTKDNESIELNGPNDFIVKQYGEKEGDGFSLFQFYEKKQK